MSDNKETLDQLQAFMEWLLLHYRASDDLIAEAGLDGKLVEKLTDHESRHYASTAAASFVDMVNEMITVNPLLLGDAGKYIN